MTNAGTRMAEAVAIDWSAIEARHGPVNHDARTRIEIRVLAARSAALLLHADRVVRRRRWERLTIAAAHADSTTVADYVAALPRRYTFT